MSGFTALNIIPDDESDEEVDNTKEIQIEEALKLYQTALKLHSQGPLSFVEARTAYDALFESEIFKYPESLPQPLRSEPVEPLDQASDDDDEYLDTQVISKTAVGGGVDGVPSTLPQILYLAFKNHGQFDLDHLKYKLESQRDVDGSSLSELKQDLEGAVARALVAFSAALARDESDLELWRRTARVGAAWGSTRLSRFCLEAVLDEREGFEGELGSLRLEEAIASEDLKELLQTLQDNVALSQPPISTLKTRRLAPFLRGRLDPYPYLPHMIKDDSNRLVGNPLGKEPARCSLDITTPTWAAVGKALLHQIVAQQHGIVGVGAGAGIRLNCESSLWERMMDAEAPTHSSRSVEVPIGADLVSSESGAGNSSPEKQTTATNDGDQKMADSSEAIEEAKDDDGAAQRSGSQPTERSPSRKRTLSSAGLQDGDSGRVRSKRIRARESVADGASEERSALELAKQYDEQAQIYVDADEWMFNVVGGLLQKLGVNALGTASALKEAFGRVSQSTDTAIGDMHSLLRVCADDESHSARFGHGLGAIGSSDGTGSASSRKAGLLAFLEDAKTASHKPTSRPLVPEEKPLAYFARRINQDWLTVKETALQWIDCLLLGQRGMFSDEQASTYLQHSWPDSLKEAVVRMLVGLDEVIYGRIRRLCLDLENRGPSKGQTSLDEQEAALVEMAQSVFELHLDIYDRITNPSSEVESATRLAQRDRLDRWSAIVNHLMNLRPNEEADDAATDRLYLRYLWASAIYAGMSEGVTQEHVILCMTDLKGLLMAAGDPVIELQNNATMPEISSAAADREISRLTTMDFFLHIFQAEEADPLTLIETLEPVLEPPNGDQTLTNGHAAHDGELRVKDEESDRSASPLPVQPPTPSTQTQELSKFLHGGSTALRLFLWKRLEEAYSTIEYPPKVMSCILQSIEVVMDKLKSPSYLETPAKHRPALLSKWIHSLDDLVVRALALALNDSSALDCLDEGHLKTVLTAMAELCRLLHTFALFEDAARIEQVSVPRKADHTPPPSFLLLAGQLRDMQMRTWTLLYIILKEATGQNKALFPDATENLVEYLRAVHHATGIRFFCQASNKVLLKFIKMELLRMGNSESWEADLIQVLHDLHGLRLASGKFGIEDHDCKADALDRRTAIQIMSFVMKLVKRVNLKDLPKTEYKTAMDKMQQAIAAPKQTSGMLHNMRVFAAFIKSSINPINLYYCLKGQVELSAVPIPPELSKIADKRWYLLLGQMALTRFQCQKRVSQAPTDELDLASYFFRLDLQYTMDRWETWYCQAQMYDSRIEEEVLWSFDKMNKDKTEANLLQRNAIHCYTMAVSTAFRFADDSAETAQKISSLFTDFGTRIYASSRPPFGMEAFWLDDFERHFSGSQRMYKKPPHMELSEYKAWKFASVLFRNALLERPGLWKNHYMLGKCLWKMYRHQDNTTEHGGLVKIEHVLEAFVRSIETLPERRSDRQDPILEPHYKLVSAVHKSIQDNVLEPPEASEILQATPHARKVPPAQDRDGWDPYVLQILKMLRAADKANWHHRMTARAAHILYDDSPNDILAAAAARHELSQQIFTKTMAIQVWRPEYERAGRHFVYTSRYVDFFNRLLLQLNDRGGMEALVKRVRKKSSDFFDHQRVWSSVCHAYIKILRHAGQIGELYDETAFKAISYDEFQANSERLQSWSQDSTVSNPTLDILRDAIELKKLNNSLMKSTLFDDLIADIYASLYEAVVPTLPPAEKPADAEKKDDKRDMMSVNSLIMDRENVAEAQPSQSEAPAPKHRVKGVSRREILRKADAAVTKAVPTVQATKTPRLDTAKVNVSDPAISSGPASPQTRDETAMALDSSALGSLHDSAGDASGESDEEEEVLPRPLFPNLVEGSLKDDASASH